MAGPWYPHFAPDLYPEELAPYIAIGALVTTAGSAEAHLSTMILRLMGDEKGYNPLVYPALSGMAITPKLGVLRSLLKIRFDAAAQKALGEAIALIRDGFDDRDVVAHAHIGRGRHPGEVYVAETKLTRTGNLPDPTHWPLDRIWKAAFQIKEGCEIIDRGLDGLGIPKFAPRLPATLAPTPHPRQ